MVGTDNEMWHPALAGVTLLLVDFDGPLVRLLPDPEHLVLTGRLVQWYADRAGKDVDVPTVDHVQVLRQIHTDHPDLAIEAEALATDHELAAAATREAYSDAIDVLREWLAGGGRVAVVSNNSELAVRRVLTRSGFGGDSAYTLHARRPDNLHALKPHPDLLHQAMAAHATPPANAIMIGDTTSDVRAGTAAGVRTIGIAENATRGGELHDAGAVAVLGRLSDLQR